MARLFDLVADLWALFAVAVALSVLVFLVVASIGRFGRSALDRSATLALVCFTFAVAGISTGYLTGLSRNPAVDSVVPAVLTVFGGFATFLISTRPRDSVGVVVGATTSLFLFFLIAELTGARIREENANWAANEQLQFQLDYGAQFAIAMQEAKIKAMREKLGLPVTPVTVFARTEEEHVKKGQDK